MTDQPPPIPRPRTKDDEHLQLLAIFHFVFAGFTVLGLGFLALHYTFMNVMFSNPDMWKNQKGGPPPEQFFAVFKWIYLFFAVVVIAGGTANLLSAIFIRRRRNRIFSMVVAGFNCAQFPFGTALGVFTFVILLRDSVRELYGKMNAEKSASDYSG